MGQERLPWRRIRRRIRLHMNDGALGPILCNSKTFLEGAVEADDSRSLGLLQGLIQHIFGTIQEVGPGLSRFDIDARPSSEPARRKNATPASLRCAFPIPPPKLTSSNCRIESGGGRWIGRKSLSRSTGRKGCFFRPWASQQKAFCRPGRGVSQFCITCSRNQRGHLTVGTHVATHSLRIKIECDLTVIALL